MTTYQEFPLRPQGAPWPGLNTKGGILDPGQGYLEDGSKNQIINEADVLEKRQGFVRGLNERFTGVVCGLFRYTSGCGVEYLIVSDESGISVRTPFEIPSFLGTDSIPFDDFETLDTSKWSGTDVYEVFLGALRLNGTDTVGTTNYVPLTQLMRWFKASVVESYFVEINYRLQAFVDQQVASVIIKGDDPENPTAYLEASIVSTPLTYRAYLFLVIGGVRSTLADSDIDGGDLADGFLQLSYNAGTFTATMKITPSGGGIQTIPVTITEAQSTALGQWSGLGLLREAQDVTAEIESVSGGQA